LEELGKSDKGRVTKGNGAVLCRIFFFEERFILKNVTTFTEYWAAGLQEWNSALPGSL
jgi:hypothetical protein